MAFTFLRDLLFEEAEMSPEPASPVDEKLAQAPDLTAEVQGAAEESAGDVTKTFWGAAEKPLEVVEGTGTGGPSTADVTVVDGGAKEPAPLVLDLNKPPTEEPVFTLSDLHDGPKEPVDADPVVEPITLKLGDEAMAPAATASETPLAKTEPVEAVPAPDAVTTEESVSQVEAAPVMAEATSEGDVSLERLDELEMKARDEIAAEQAQITNLEQRITLLQADIERSRTTIAELDHTIERLEAVRAELQILEKNAQEIAAQRKKLVESVSDATRVVDAKVEGGADTAMAA